MRKRAGWQEAEEKGRGVYCHECLKIHQKCICEKGANGGGHNARDDKGDVPETPYRPGTSHEDDVELFTCARCDVTLPDYASRRFCFAANSEGKKGFHIFCKVCEPIPKQREGFLKI